MARYSEQPKNSMMPGCVFHTLRALEAIAQTAEVVCVTARDLTETGADLIELNLVRVQADIAKQMSEDGLTVPEKYQHLLPKA